MTVTERGVPLKCMDNKTHRLVFSMRAMVSLEKLYANGEYSPGFAEIINKLDPTNPSMTLLSNLVWAGIVHEDLDLTPDEVLTLIDYDTMKGMAYVFEQLDKAIALAMGVDREAIIEEREKAQAAEKAGEKIEAKKSIGQASKKADADSSE